METTKLSSKGQVIIPKLVRSSHHWEPGQELEVIDVGDGVLLKAKSPFEETTIEDVVGCLAYKGPAKSLDAMEEAIQAGVKEQTDDCS
ncbi:MAG: AbrB/MazE/SpoVT family DNA-binding domain-containing protein [Candidatus Polarisedimenticolaceae bacterium]|nr:AbrB/MazE/SpoVT family DNA-binding domain-containing protein [Candidatus Polarisedimenticolaceae bacterium]